jgi:hypothetical protein
MEENDMKYFLIVIIAAAILLALIIPLRGQLSDCRFECNHLQTKIDRLQELSDYIPAMENILNPLQLAELKTLSEMIRQQRYHEYERIEQPLLTEKEIGG